MQSEPSANILFLLGGHDLEMIFIRDLLKNRNLAFRDNNLQWDTAQLSRYKEEIKAGVESYSTIYGVELYEDIEPPDNYKRIDHHNELLYMPSSLEQVAGILNKKLDRCEMLIAINDRSYIPGLIQYGASHEEIEDIRKKDRAAQGVSPDDEKLADASIQNHLEVIEGITVVRSLTEHFSSITDRLFGKTNDQLLILTPNKLTYFGSASSHLATYYKYLIVQGKAYAGGNPPGFFGLVNNAIPTAALESNFLPSILKIVAHG